MGLWGLWDPQSGFTERVLVELLDEDGFCEVQRVGSFKRFLGASMVFVMDVVISLHVMVQPSGQAAAAVQRESGPGSGSGSIRTVVMHNCSAYPDLEYNKKRNWYS